MKAFQKSSLKKYLVACAAFVALASACNKDESSRCHFCGMQIAPDAAWSAEVKRADGRVDHFDTPRCAFGSVAKGDEPAGSVVRVQEFYDRTWLDAKDLKFAIGSDVSGPMGADLVPLLPAHADKFAHDHTAGRVVDGSQVNAALLGELR